MIKRTVGSVIAALLITLGIPAVASAHVLKVDGNIGAVMHINPDDNPTVGKSTDIVMSFDDVTGRFSLPKCNCELSIIKNGKTVANNSLVVSSDEVSENHFTFVKPDVYDMRFTGNPKVIGAFQPFTLDYEVRVGQDNSQQMGVLLWVGMGMGIGLVLLAAFATNYDSNEPWSKGYQ